MGFKVRLAEGLKKSKEFVSRTVETVKSKVPKKPTKSTPDGDGKSPDGPKIKKFPVPVIEIIKEKWRKKKPIEEPALPSDDLQVEEPAHMPVAEPAHMPVAEPACTPVAEPAHTSVAEPAYTQVEEPAHTVGKKPNKSAPDRAVKSSNGLKRLAVSVSGFISKFKRPKHVETPTPPLGDIQIEIFFSKVNYDSILQQVEKSGIVKIRFIPKRFIPKNRKIAIWVLKFFEHKIVKELNNRLEAEKWSFTVHNLVPFYPKPTDGELGILGIRFGIVVIDYPSLFKKLQDFAKTELIASLFPWIKEKIGAIADIFFNLVLNEAGKRDFVAKQLSENKEDVIDSLNKLAEKENFKIYVTDFKCKVVTKNQNPSRVLEKINSVSEWLDKRLTEKYHLIVWIFIVPVCVFGLVAWLFRPEDINIFNSFLLLIGVLTAPYAIRNIFKIKPAPPLLKTVFICIFLGIFFSILIPLIPFFLSIIPFSFVTVSILSKIIGLIFYILALISFICNFLLFFKSW